MKQLTIRIHCFQFYGLHTAGLCTLSLTVPVYFENYFCYTAGNGNSETSVTVKNRVRLRCFSGRRRGHAERGVPLYYYSVTQRRASSGAPEEQRKELNVKFAATELCRCATREQSGERLFFRVTGVF